MGNLLFLVHRLPFPPDKGDKVRSYHLLKHLAARHRVFLGTFVDDPDDELHVDSVRLICPDLHVARINAPVRKIRSLVGLLTRQALSLCYYRDPQLHAWVRHTLTHHKIDAVVVFSSVMAQYTANLHGLKCPSVLIDFVDVDSAKWTQYAPSHLWPLSWLYRREGEKLQAYEREISAKAKASFFVTHSEAALFKKIAPECAASVVALSNGVDADYFSPQSSRPSPFFDGPIRDRCIPIVFTGAMDYWPNIDAVIWFVSCILPQIRREWPNLCLYIVGRNPPAVVLALAASDVVVTGTVPDVRPYLQHAALVVAPLRVARGIQNKILEAMAMARPVVASTSCVNAIRAEIYEEILSATSCDDFVREIDTLLRDPARALAIGLSARSRIINSFSWATNLGGIDSYLSDALLEQEEA